MKKVTLKSLMVKPEEKKQYEKEIKRNKAISVYAEKVSKLVKTKEGTENYKHGLYLGGGGRKLPKKGCKDKFIWAGFVKGCDNFCEKQWNKYLYETDDLRKGRKREEK